MNEGPTLVVTQHFSCRDCKYLGTSMEIREVEYDGTLGEVEVYICTHPNTPEKLRKALGIETPHFCPFNPYKKSDSWLKWNYPNTTTQ